MIQFSQINKAFGTQQVLIDVTFTVHPGERVGLVGPNGAGKSTLFEILTGNLSPDKGEATYPGNLRLAYVRQQIHGIASGVPLLDYVENAMPELNLLHAKMEQLEAQLPTATENEKQRMLDRLGEMQTEYEHKGGYELKNRAETILSGLGFDTARFLDLFDSFSGGWKIRAELARNLVAQPDILLLDEPTNYLDVPAVEWLQEFLKSYKGTLLLISHDRYLLNCLTNVTLEVMGGHVTRYPGNYDKYVKDREQRHEQLIAQQRNIDRKRDQLERFVDRFRYKATKAAQAQSRQKILDKLDDVEIPQVYVRAPKIVLPPAPRSGQDVVRIEGMGFSYDGKRPIFSNLDMRIERGDKAAFVGLNGMGKTTLLRLIAGHLKPDSGKIQIGHGVLMGYQSQDYMETMDPSKSIFGTVREASADRSDGELRNMLGGFGFSGDNLEKQVQVLSGGEKLRLALARLLLRPNNFLLLDEPTTHLDIYARESLEEALRNYNGTLCLVSHDITFVRNLATTIYELSPEGVTRYYGNYDYYREKLAEKELKLKAAAEAKAAETPVQSASSSGSTLTRKDRKREEVRIRDSFSAERRKWEKRVAEDEALITEKEAELGRIFNELSANNPNTDYAALNKRVPILQREIEEATTLWEKASYHLEAVQKQIEEALSKIP
ncbi:MAG: ABC-F family ATP-binding cassette domain-containing protein [Victivallales bacterium]|nr:ABC-F family ATP-binding cassette domain-containing protein [Victivallales bacterium]